MQDGHSKLEPLLFFLDGGLLERVNAGLECFVGMFCRNGLYLFLQLSWEFLCLAFFKDCLPIWKMNDGKGRTKKPLLHSKLYMFFDQSSRCMHIHIFQVFPWIQGFLQHGEGERLFVD